MLIGAGFFQLQINAMIFRTAVWQYHKDLLTLHSTIAADVTTIPQWECRL